MNAAVIGNNNLQMNMFLPTYATHWRQVLGLNETFTADLHRLADQCGFTRYLREHFLFRSPAKPFRDLVWQNDSWALENCDMLPSIAAAARLMNPCFNVYHITDACPWPS